MDTNSDRESTTRNADLRMARTLLNLYIQLHLADEQVWPILASAAEQPEHRLEALTRPTPPNRPHKRPPP